LNLRVVILNNLVMINYL